MPFLTLMWKYKTSIIYFSIALSFLLCYNAYKRTSIENSKLKTSIEQLQTLVDQKDQEIELVKQNVKTVIRVQEKVSQEKVKLQEKTKKLRDTFDKHDLSNLAFKKPVLIEKVINRASEQKRKCLEDITSSPECFVD